jgi:hypothetical protein
MARSFVIRPSTHAVPGELEPVVDLNRRWSGCRGVERSAVDAAHELHTDRVAKVQCTISRAAADNEARLEGLEAAVSA